MNFTRFIAYASVGTSIMLLAAGCTDDKYDLSDIDSEVQLDVNDLSVPIKMDEITMGSVLKLKEGQGIKMAQAADGSTFYVMVEEGEFDAASINVEKVHVKAPQIPSTDNTVTANSPQSSRRRASGVVTFQLHSDASPFSYEATDVDPAIVSISAFEGDMIMDWSISLQGLSGVVKSLTMSNLVFQLPKGLDLVEDEGGKYDPSTGLLTISHRRVAGTSLSLHMRAAGIDYITAGGELKDHTLLYTGSIYIKSGEMSIDPAADLHPGVDPARIPSQLNMHIDYRFSDITINRFSGEIQYDIKDFNIPDIQLNNIPKVLSDDRTDIILNNPCILLHLNNPFQQYNLRSETGFSLTAIRPSGHTTYSINNNTFTLTVPNHSPEYNYCLSPTLIQEVARILPNTDNEQPISTAQFMTPAPEHVPFTSLRDVLSSEETGGGLPTSITANVSNPRIPCQRVSNFPLGSGEMTITGSYLLYAPLQFEPGSEIFYTDQTTGWTDGDLKDLTVTSLTVEADLVSTFPFDAVLTGTVLDSDGNPINNVTINPISVKAGQQNHITITTTASTHNPIIDLDGMSYSVVADAISSHAPINPSQYIRLTNIRPHVSGYYRKKL